MSAPAALDIDERATWLAAADDVIEKLAKRDRDLGIPFTADDLCQHFDVIGQPADPNWIGSAFSKASANKLIVADAQPLHAALPRRPLGADRGQGHAVVLPEARILPARGRHRRHCGVLHRTRHAASLAHLRILPGAFVRHRRRRRACDVACVARLRRRVLGPCQQHHAALWPLDAVQLAGEFGSDSREHCRQPHPGLAERRRLISEKRPRPEEFGSRPLLVSAAGQPSRYWSDQ